ncbi:MAG: GAF domain-containing protein [Chloroflexota bacterium]
MRIRLKLLLLVVFLGLALVVNLLALGYLARTMTTALQTIEEVGLNQQLVAIQMQARLRDAEAALYRYIIEGETGFAIQFKDQLQKFQQDVAAYQGQTSTAQEEARVEVLTVAYQQATEIGQELIQLRDSQTSDLADLEVAQATLTTQLTGPIRAAHPDDGVYQKTVSDMHDHLREVFLAVTSYLTSSKETEPVRFSEAVIGFRQRLAQFKALASTSEERRRAEQIDRIFSRIEALGLRLISAHNQQQALFANFAAILFHAGEEVLVGQIQPQAARNLATAQQHLQAALNFAVMASLVFALSVSVLAGAITWPLLRQMNAGILALLHGAERVAAGNLARPVYLNGRDELSQLAAAFNAMMTDLDIRERDLQARLSELEALRQIGLQLTRTLDPDQVLATIATSALTLVGAMEVHIFVGAAPAASLEFAASAWRDETRRGQFRQPRADGITATAARTGQPQVVPQADTHPLFNSPDMRQWDIKAAASLPLKLGERVLGVLNVSFDDRRLLGEDTLRLLGLLADQAAIALENARLYQSLADREARLQTLAHKLAHVQEEERRLIGLDLHDGLTQLLLSANMHIDTLASLAGHLESQAGAELNLAQARLQEAIAEARQVVSELRPIALEDYGLVSGLRHYVTGMSQRENWQLEFSAPGEVKLEPAIEAAIFRIVQEALSNTRKYAATARIRVALQLDESELQLQVQDWGQGFNPADISEESRHLGLLGMRERAALLDGECRVTSRPGEGTHICIRIPLVSEQ